MRAIRKLERIEDNGGCYKFSVWKNGNRVYGDLYIGGCFEEAMKLAEESDADEIEAAVWYSEDDYINRMMADDFITVWERK